MAEAIAVAGIRYRPCEPGDAAPIAALDATVSPQPWSPSQLQRFCAGSDVDGGWVAQLDEVLAGFVIYTAVIDTAEINNIVVAPQWHRTGIGSGLLTALCSQLRKDGAVRCLLEVRRSNQPALALYHRHGFVEQGVRRDYYALPGGGTEDALLMSLEL